jgi:hypothetical protein
VGGEREREGGKWEWGGKRERQEPHIKIGQHVTPSLTGASYFGKGKHTHDITLANWG